MEWHRRPLRFQGVYCRVRRRIASVRCGRAEPSDVCLTDLPGLSLLPVPVRRPLPLIGVTVQWP